MLDLKTVLVVCEISMVFQFVVVLLLWRAHKKTFPCLNDWLVSWLLLLIYTFLTIYVVVVEAPPYIEIAVNALIILFELIILGAIVKLIESPFRFRHKYLLFIPYFCTPIFYNSIPQLPELTLNISIVIIYSATLFTVISKRGQSYPVEAKFLFVMSYIFFLFSGLCEAATVILLMKDLITPLQEDMLEPVIYIIALLASSATIIAITLVIGRQLTNKVEEYRDTLKEQVDAKSKQLVQQEKRALVGVLSAGFAHDIINPLHTVNTTLKMVEQGCDFFAPHFEYCAERVTDTLGDVTAAEFMHELPESLRFIRESYDHIEGISQMMKALTSPVPVSKNCIIDITTEVNNAIELVRSYIDLNVANFTSNIPDETINIEGNSVQVQQVIMNLLKNATEAITSRDEYLKVVVKVTQNQSVLIRIINSGTPLSEDSLEKMLTPYYTTKTAQDGAGLGLFMVQLLVEEHRGHFDLYRGDDQETIAEVTFPLVTSRERESHAK